MKKQKLGAWGEDLGQTYLERKGYEIISRNIRLGNQEVDIVCSHEGKVIIVEVKTKIKHRLIKPEDMMSRHKLRNLKLASYKLSRFLKTPLNDIRFDLLAIEVDRVAKNAKIRHYKDII